MTGGLQEQVTDGESWFGLGIKPTSKAIIGSQNIPWIFEDRLAGNDVVEALENMYFMSKEKRTELGLAGRQHVINNYSFETFNKTWVDTLTQLHEEEGSWDTRKQKQRWTMEEIAL